MRKYREYTDKDVIIKAKEVKSISGLLRALGLVPAGGNFVNIKKILQKLKVDCSHWTGSAWNKGERLKDWQSYTQIARLKKHLISLRGHQCQKCELTHWLKLLIPLEVHHIDGDRTNNNLTNLKLLCPNCHAYTDNYRGKKNLTIKQKKESNT